jgi:hypothetical protein
MHNKSTSGQPDVILIIGRVAICQTANEKARLVIDPGCSID